MKLKKLYSLLLERPSLIRKKRKWKIGGLHTICIAEKSCKTIRFKDWLEDQRLIMFNLRVLGQARREMLLALFNEIYVLITLDNWLQHLKSLGDNRLRIVIKLKAELLMWSSYRNKGKNLALQMAFRIWESMWQAKTTKMTIQIVLTMVWLSLNQWL